MMHKPIEHYDTYEIERPMREAKKRRQRDKIEYDNEEKWVEEDREERELCLK